MSPGGIRTLLLATAAGVVMWAVLVGLTVSDLAVPAGTSTKIERTCLEDEPCWRWTHMGNRKRGVVTLHGNYRVAGACKFRRLWESGFCNGTRFRYVFR